MGYYKPAQLKHLVDAINGLSDRADTLITALYRSTLVADPSREYAIRGLGRRIKSIEHSIKRVFQELPPDLDHRPGRWEREEATIHIQAVYFHVWGCFDNLAHMWVAERKITKPDGSSLPVNRIGFAKRCVEVRFSLPIELIERLDNLDHWMNWLSAFRHASGHKIPLYIPPYVVHTRDASEYKHLEEELDCALALGHHEFADTLMDQMDALGTFRPVIAISKYSSENSLFHPQLIANFATLEEWTNLIIRYI